MKNVFFGLFLAIFAAVGVLGGCAVSTPKSQRHEIMSWEIISVEKNAHDIYHAATDTHALYEVAMSEAKTKNRSMWVMYSSLEYEDVVYLLRYFGVDKLQQLSGKMFESPHHESTSALDLLVVQTRHYERKGTRYVPPSAKEIRERIVRALAKMEQPYFPDVDMGTMRSASYKMYGEGIVMFHEKLAELQELVRAASDGKVSLVEANYEEFGLRIRGPATYLKLVRGVETQRVIIGPYVTPVIFDGVAYPAIPSIPL